MKERTNMVVEEETDSPETVAVDTQLAEKIISELAEALQKCVYVPEEGDQDDPLLAIVYAPFSKINNIFLEVAQKYGVKTPTEQN